ncbi:actin-related protein [Botrytis cinerea]
MSHSSGPAHRSVSSIRPSINPQSGSGAPSTPHTPIRQLSNSFGSPSTLRAEEECIVIEIGCRYVKVGFAGDAGPKAVVNFGPEEQRRAGDFRRWQPGYDKAWRERIHGKKWGEAHELWKLDLRDVDLGWPRKVTLALPSILPSPLLSTILDTMFTNFQSPNISLHATPALTTVAAGLRAAMIVDIGWSETIVTGTYEFREVSSHRSIRATKLLGQAMRRLLAESFDPKILMQESSDDQENVALEEFISFEECEEIVNRMAWCKPTRNFVPKPAPERSLAPLEEEAELQTGMRSLNITEVPDSNDIATIPLKSTLPPRKLRIPFSQLAQPCEEALLATHVPTPELDDEELPIHLLLYQALLRLPVDLRSVCMSRIVFVGGGASIIGLKARILEELNTLVEERGWDPVQGKAVSQFRSNPKLTRRRQSQTPTSPTSPIETPSSPPLSSPSSPSSSISPTTPRPPTLIPAAHQSPEPDSIAATIHAKSDKFTIPEEKGFIRAIESLGAWSGASLLSQLKIPAVSSIDREAWMQHGLSGANRNAEVSVAAGAGNRGSMGPGAFKGGVGEKGSWTLGLWGS